MRDYLNDIIWANHYGQIFFFKMSFPYIGSLLGQLYHEYINKPKLSFHTIECTSSIIRAIIVQGFFFQFHDVPDVIIIIREDLHLCSICDSAKVFLTSEFSYLLSSNPTHKIETGTARWQM